YHNEGGGRFTEVGLQAGVAVAGDGKARAGMGTDFADYDHDGLLDLVVTNHEFETNSLFRNLGRSLFVDYDNDASLDLAIVNGHVIDNAAAFHTGSKYAQRRMLFRNVGGRRFSE